MPQKTTLEKRIFLGNWGFFSAGMIQECAILMGNAPEFRFILYCQVIHFAGIKISGIQ
jgi:hypothetical protein